MRRAIFVSLSALVAACGGGTVHPPTEQKGCPDCMVSSELMLAAEIAPASTSNGGPALPSQEVSSLVLDVANNRFSFMLETPVTLSGTVSSQSAKRPLAATILATRPSRISGRPDVSYQTSIDPNTGAFSLLVSPTHAGESYTVRLLPDSDSVDPPETFVVDASRDRALDAQLADPQQLLQIHGVITDALQAGMTGMQVVAIDPLTGATLSTAATTDGNGAFAVKLSPPASSVGGASLPAALTLAHLVASPPKNAPLPTLEIPVDISHAGPTNSITVNLMTPPLPAASQLVFTVLGVGSSGTQMPVVAAHCLFSADVSDGISPATATYQVSADTDANGKATLALIPAAEGNRVYQVAVSPPVSSDFQATVTSVSVASASGSTAPLVLAQRARVSGRVLGPDSSPVKNLMVVPTPATVAAALVTPSAIGLVTAAASGLTDGQGEFVLRLDAGAYDFGLIPPSNTTLPLHWVDGQQISSDIDLPDIALPAGATVIGQLADALGQPLVGADVRLYSLVATNANCATTDDSCLAPPRLVAEGISIADGTLPVLLPAAAASAH